MAHERFDGKLYGGNASAFNCREPEVFLCGPAGTGKSIANLFKLFVFGDKYPGTRMLLARKTRAALTESALVTWERDILGLSHRMLRSRPVMRKVRHDYIFPNGSELIVGGLDRPDKVLSTDYDIICLNEAIDFTVDDFETLTGRLRTGVAPYQQMIGDLNPGNPNHWLYKRAMRGTLKLVSSLHTDNPRFFDRNAPGETNVGTADHPRLVRGQWTAEGRKYVFGRLGSMTGIRRARFLDGIWKAAEGLVYDGYQPHVHNLPAGWRPPDHWRRLWSIDWGFTAPLVLQVWALDDDGRLYLYREIYRTRVRVDELGKMCRRWLDEAEEPRPLAVVTDIDPGDQDTFTRNSGLACTDAWKHDKYERIQQAQARFDVAGDGRPRIFFRPDCRDGAEDYDLLQSDRPTSTMEELGGYVWDTQNPDKLKEEPLKVNDHGMDAMRYVITKADQFTGGTDVADTGTVEDTITGDVRSRSY